MNITRRIAYVVAGAIFVIGTPTTAFAATAKPTTKNFSAEITSNVTNVKTTGSAYAIYHKDIKHWQAGVQVKKLPKGNYDFTILVGKDVNRDGTPDSFKQYVMCSFTSAGVNQTSGCGGDVYNFKRTGLTKYTYVEIVNRGSVQFSAASGALVRS